MTIGPEPRPVEQIAGEVIADDVAKNGSNLRPGKQPRSTVLRTMLRRSRAPAAALIAAAAVALIAVAISGGFDSGSAPPKVFSSSAPVLTGGDGVSRSFYWHGYPTAFTGCTSAPGKLGKSAPFDYAGTIWLRGGVLHASTAFTGLIRTDGVFSLHQPDGARLSGQIVPDATGNSGTLRGNYSYAGEFGGPACVVHGVIVSGQVGLQDGGFGPRAKIAVKP